MQPLSRRAFLGWLAASVPAAALVRRAHAASVDHLASSNTLHAVGQAVLPTELGVIGTSAAVTHFQQWMTGYREGAELLHGYGTSKLEHSGPTPATKWAAQLDQLDAAARTQHGRSFANLPLEVRRQMVRDALTPLNAQRLPAIGRAPHVALALLAHFYASPEATDRCYSAHLGKQTCRPLAAQAREPLPLARGGKLS